tara:strand:- start:684 stop:1244 length:561 start_codon:yes stop_codon:yes gene_type:complete
MKKRIWHGFSKSDFRSPQASELAQIFDAYPAFKETKQTVVRFEAFWPRNPSQTSKPFLRVDIAEGFWIQDITDIVESWTQPVNELFCFPWRQREYNCKPQHAEQWTTWQEWNTEVQGIIARVQTFVSAELRPHHCNVHSTSRVTAPSVGWIQGKTHDLTLSVNLVCHAPSVSLRARFANATPPTGI